MRAAAAHIYAVAIGSNRRGRHGSPDDEVHAAIRAVGAQIAARVVGSAPVGPSIRRFANSVAIVSDTLDPPAMLARLKTIERAFGRRRGRRWGARVIDLDIILWSGGMWRSPGLTIPHPAWREREFVTAPLAEIAPGWRDPRDGLTVRHHHARLTRRAPLPRRP